MAMDCTRIFKMGWCGCGRKVGKKHTREANRAGPKQKSRSGGFSGTTLEKCWGNIGYLQEAFFGAFDAGQSTGAFALCLRVVDFNTEDSDGKVEQGGQEARLSAATMGQINGAFADRASTNP